MHGVMTNHQFAMTNKCPITKGNKIFNIKDRAMELAVNTANFIRNLTKNQLANEYGKQLIRSSASIGANLIEADGALSKRDFINKLGISRREAKETRYWLELISRLNLTVNDQERTNNQLLIQETKEIVFILSSIISNTKQNEKS